MPEYRNTLVEQALESLLRALGVAIVAAPKATTPATPTALSLAREIDFGGVDIDAPVESLFPANNSRVEEVILAAEAARNLRERAVNTPSRLFVEAERLGEVCREVRQIREEYTQADLRVREDVGDVLRDPEVIAVLRRKCVGGRITRADLPGLERWLRSLLTGALVSQSEAKRQTAHRLAEAKLEREEVKARLQTMGAFHPRGKREESPDLGGKPYKGGAKKRTRAECRARGPTTPPKAPKKGGRK